MVKHGQIIFEDPVTKPAVDYASRTIVRYADTAHIRNISQRYLEEWIEGRRQE